jgi:hypothetical protein
MNVRNPGLRKPALVALLFAALFGAGLAMASSTRSTADACQTKIDYAVSELKLTTVGYINHHWTIPPAGTHWSNALLSLAAARTGCLANTTTTATTATTATTTPTSTTWASFVGFDAYRTSDFAAISTVGFKRVRMDNASQTTINLGASYGIKVLPIAAYNPWSDLNGGRGDKYPPYPQYYSTWASRMVAQWSNPGEAIECWNEPWNAVFWQPTPDPDAYIALCKTLAAAAWAKWPNVKILISADAIGSANTKESSASGCTNCGRWRYWLLKDDTSSFLNDPRVLPTTHNYVQGRTPTQVTSQPCYWDLDRFKCAYNDFKAHGHPNPQVWITEFGWESGVVGETNQSNYVVQAFNIFRNSGMVVTAYAFLYKTNESFDYNWLRPDNSAKPVVAAVKSLIASG